MVNGGGNPPLFLLGLQNARSYIQIKKDGKTVNSNVGIMFHT
jgi:hypothetical protein